MDEVFEKIRDIIHDLVGVNKDKITMDFDIKTYIYMNGRSVPDGNDMRAVWFTLEEEFNIDFDSDYNIDYEDLCIVGNIYKWVKKLYIKPNSPSTSTPNSSPGGRLVQGNTAPSQSSGSSFDLAGTTWIAKGSLLESTYTFMAGGKVKSGGYFGTWAQNGNSVRCVINDFHLLELQIVDSNTMKGTTKNVMATGAGKPYILTRQT